MKRNGIWGSLKEAFEIVLKRYLGVLILLTSVSLNSESLFWPRKESFVHGCTYAAIAWMRKSSGQVSDK